jgi:hypothetical protein
MTLSSLLDQLGSRANSVVVGGVSAPNLGTDVRVSVLKPAHTIGGSRSSPKEICG